MEPELLEFIKSLQDKLDKSHDELTEIKIILGRQEESLRLHVYRTDLAEQNIEMLRQEFQPIRTHVNYVQGGLKLIGLLGTIGGIILSILKITKVF